MYKTLVVARKETNELMRTRSTILIGLGFAFFFSLLNSLAIIKGKDSASAISLDNSVFYLSAMVGLFIAYMSTGQIFLREKADRVIETLMCAPVNLRQIWLGKVLGVSVPAYLLSLLTVLLIIVISSILSNSLLLPTTAILVHVLLVVPTLIAAFAGLYGSGYVIGGSFAISWIQVGILFGISVLLLAITAYLTKRLSRERIVTTIT